MPNLTETQIRARLIVWSAAKAARGCTLTDDETSGLWASILDTQVELRRVRDDLETYKRAFDRIQTALDEREGA